eukprot:1830923-Rhodomonas_salina.5
MTRGGLQRRDEDPHTDEIRCCAECGGAERTQGRDQGAAAARSKHRHPEQEGAYATPLLLHVWVHGPRQLPHRKGCQRHADEPRRPDLL